VLLLLLWCTVFQGATRRFAASVELEIGRTGYEAFIPNVVVLRCIIADGWPR
jgi:hypothetical protein